MRQHRDSLGRKLACDREKMSPEKLQRRHRNTWVGVVLIGFGILIGGVALTVMLVKMLVVTPLIVLLCIGLGVALYGAHMIPSQTDKADAFLKDALSSAREFLPGKKT